MVLLNPFAVGSTNSGLSASAPVQGDLRRPLRATCVDRGLLNRGILLSGRMRTHIRWNADSSSEFIEVDGERLISQTAILRSIPRFRFELVYSNGVYQSRHEAIVDVGVRFGFLVSRFRLILDDVVVYQEGRWLDDDHRSPAHRTR
ncbi:MAG: hypothetical protein AAF670_16685 [Planctomycetota bacterium]